MEPVSADAIYVRQLELGPMQNFVYLVGDPETRQCVVVDPAWGIDTIVETAQADDMAIVGALVTHTHQDHVGGTLEDWGMTGRIPGVEELLARVSAKVYVHKAEGEFLRGFGSPPRGPLPLPGSQLRRRLVHDRAGEAPEPVPALRVARRLPPGDGRRPHPLTLARTIRERRIRGTGGGRRAPGAPERRHRGGGGGTGP